MGEVQAALLALTLFTTYCRPIDLATMQEQDLIRPTTASDTHALLLHPEDRGTTSKVGMGNESMLLDSSVMPWLGLMLERN